MMYELGCLDNGEISRGGIKAPLLTVGKWIRENTALYPDVVFFAVPASPEAVTREELYADLDAFTAEYEARHDA